MTREDFIGNLLRYGLLIATSLVALGASLYLYRHGLDPIHYKVFVRQLHYGREITNVFHLALDQSGVGRGLILLGLWLLLILQVARVALTAWIFKVEKDAIFAGFSVIVLALLLFSLLLNYL